MSLISAFKSLTSFFKPALHLPLIEDAEEVKNQYKYWRWRIFYSMYLGYAFYYLSRKSFTFAIPALKIDLGFRNDELGILSSVFALAYGVSKFTSGMLADRSNPRYFMAVGLILTGILNLCFGFSSTLWAFILFWGLNGWFQGFGWPGCARLLTHWYSQSERGKWWGMWNTSHNLGGALIPLIAGGCAEYFGWRYALYIPGLLCITFGLLLIDRLRDTPQSLGLPAIEIYRNDLAAPNVENKSRQAERELSTREILFGYVLSNHYIWLLGLAYFFIYIIRSAVNDWSALYLVECKNYTRIGASHVVCWFEIGGFCGSLISGWFSDVIFKGRRGPVNILFTLATLSTIVLWSFPIQAMIWDASMMFLLGFFIFGPQMLIGVAAAELSHKKAAATATGFTGTFAYFGAAVAGYPLGKILQEYGWPEYFYILIACCGAASLILIPFWRLRSNPIK